MMCDALWVLGKWEFCLRTRGIEKYSSMKYGNFMLILTLIIPHLTERT
jgi:hypothetical protein